MAVLYKTKAFVFGRKDVNESDRVFSVFTEDFGRLDLHAKAVRKIDSKIRGGIDIFSSSEIEFVQGKNKKTLTNAIFLEKLGDLSKKNLKFVVAHQIGEVLENFLHGEGKDQDIYMLLKEVFHNLNADLKTSRYNWLYLYFLWNALSLLGYKPEVSKCSACGCLMGPYGIYFSERAGGIVCKKCSGGGGKVNSDFVKILRIILKREWQTILRLKVGPQSQQLFERVSVGYYKYILSGHSFKNE